MTLFLLALYLAGATLFVFTNDLLKRVKPINQDDIVYDGAVEFFGITDWLLLSLRVSIWPAIAAILLLIYILGRLQKDLS